jgi:hypothetical protein
MASCAFTAISLLFLLAQFLATGTPIPTYGTYFGGTGDTNSAVAVALDSSGNVIVAGITSSQTLPGTANEVGRILVRYPIE